VIFNLDLFKYISQAVLYVCENEFVVAAWIGSVFRDVHNGLKKLLINTSNKWEGPMGMRQMSWEMKHFSLQVE
jgi:hypothetical protein